MRTLAISILLVALSCEENKDRKFTGHTVEVGSPEDLYEELFYDVQEKNVFEDSKTFVDCTPKISVDSIKQSYNQLKDRNPVTIKEFIYDNFYLPGERLELGSDSLKINEHIQRLWEHLQRDPDKRLSGTLISLPHPYIVPGGRFREVYYWDSYFTMLGLVVDERLEIVEDMLDNFSYLIDTYGFIPNGNRTYYLGRSQPPFFACMVELLARAKGDSIYLKYLPQLRKEYAFWMDGEARLENPVNGQLSLHRRVLALQEGELMNRYWDSNSTPRPESYREDVATVSKDTTRYAGVIYKHIGAAAESGWDFSSRWLTPESDYALESIHTTDFVPVDLNCLLYNLEKTIAHSLYLKGSDDSVVYLEKAARRRQAINRFCWSPSESFYMDYDFVKAEQSKVLSLAGVYPLYFRVASQEQARQVTLKIEEKFLQPGGVVTTLNYTGEQWDAPNGWAPLQWITIQGLRNYGYDSLANEIKLRWLQYNEAVYKRTYKLVEKYNVIDTTQTAGGGEYPTQDGFGWTNGVYQMLSREN